MKLVIEEPESAALRDHLAAGTNVLVTSRLALVEVVRACTLANPDPEVRDEAERLLTSCMLVAVSSQLLRHARALATASVRTMDAIHLASALRVEPDELLAYDRGLLAAASEHGLTLAHPSG